MPTRRELVLLQRNTETVTLTFTQADTGDPQDLAGVTVEVYVKANAETSDDDATLLTTTGAGGIAVSSPSTDGAAVMTVPADLTADAGESWWRADLVIGGDRKTAMYGPFIVRDT